jgi:multidrug efflux pump subunit AcrA (membrane-fusion protein)
MPQPTQPPAPPAPAPQPTPPAPAPEPPAPQPTSQTVPYDRFSQVNSEKAAAEKRAADAEARLQALEDQNKSELEKAQAQAAREKARADAADATVAKQQIGDRPAAIDADAVIALLDTGQYGEVKADDPASVTAAIGKLHEAKPTLFATSATPPQPQPFGMPASVPAPAQNNGTQPEPGSEREGMGRAMLGMLRGGV